MRAIVWVSILFDFLIIPSDRLTSLCARVCEYLFLSRYSELSVIQPNIRFESVFGMNIPNIQRRIIAISFSSILSHAYVEFYLIPRGVTDSSLNIIKD